MLVSYVCQDNSETKMAFSNTNADIVSISSGIWIMVVGKCGGMFLLQGKALQHALGIVGVGRHGQTVLPKGYLFSKDARRGMSVLYSASLSHLYPIIFMFTLIG